MENAELFEIPQSSFKEKDNVSENLIAKGTFGEVKKAIGKQDNKVYAVKFTRYDNTELGMRERNIMCQLKHNNIVKFYGYTLLKESYLGKLFTD